MRLRTFKHNNHTKVGIVKDDLIYTLPYNSMNELIESFDIDKKELACI